MDVKKKSALFYYLRLIKLVLAAVLMRLWVTYSYLKLYPAAARMQEALHERTHSEIISRPAGPPQQKPKEKRFLKPHGSEWPMFKS